MLWNIFQWRSLKTRVTLFTLIIFVGNIWLLAFYTSRTLREDMQRLLGEQQFSTASIVAVQIKDELVSRLSGLERIAETITPAMISNPQTVQSSLEARPISLSLFNGGVAVAGTDGIAIADAPHLAGRIGANFIERDYAIGALKEGKATIGRPVTSKVSMAPTFVMAVPIRDTQGKVIGALAGVTDLGKPNFLDKVTEGRYGKSGGYILISAKHRLVVTASDKSRIMQQLPAPGVVPQTDRFIQGFEGYAVYVNARGEEVLNSSKSIPVAGWNLAVTIPTAEAFAPIHAMQQRMLLAAIFLTLLTGGLTWWMLRRQLSPILATVKALVTLSHSDTTPQPLPIAKHDEIGELIGGFNRLLEALGTREEALKASEARFKVMFNEAPLGIALIDSFTGHIYSANPIFAKIAGRTLEEIENIDWMSITHPDDVQKDLDNMALLNAGKITGFQMDKRYLHPDGAIVWISMTIAPVALDDKVHPRHLCMIEDITERKQAENALRKSEHALRMSESQLLTAQQISHTGSWSYNLETNEIWGSAEALRIYGFPPESANFPIAEIEACIPERERVHQALLALIGEEREYDLEFAINPADGSPPRVLHSVAKLENDAQGKPLIVLGFIQDITERRQAEKAQQEAHERLLAVFNGLDAIVYVADMQTHELLFVNKFVEEFFGDIVGQPCWKTIQTGQSGPCAFCTNDKLLDADGNPAEIYRWEFQNTANGRWYDIHDRALPWVDGRIVRLEIATDVTERKQAEAKHVQLESQLRESQKMEALGTLAGGVAHDFNNALAAILGNVELARQDVGSAHPALVSLEEIGKAGRRAKDLVQQILAFSRRQKLERRPMSLALVVVETARLVRASLPAMVSLNVDCKGDAPAVLADATQIEQILLNLCANAAHAVADIAQPGVIEVNLTAYERTKDAAHGDLRPGRYACLTVRDNGIGMDEATRSRIFEPFFTTRPVGKGTGLGLSVVHGIVQAHEASIEVESNPGGGSTFRIYFPSVEAPAAEVTAPPLDVTPVQRKGKHVLYLDDEEAIIFLMKRLLERKGYQVSGYTEPRKALEAVRADPSQFDLAVTDYYMPGMSGLEVAQALKDIRPDLPVVMASGYISEELRAKAPAVGIRQLIYKPNTVEDLCEAVARFANGQSPEKPSS